MKIKLVFGFLLISTLLFNCKKEEVKLNINGVVTDPQAILNNKISGVEVKLLHSELAGGTFGNTFTEIASATTGSNGNYAFEFERLNTIDYKITASKEGYFSYEGTFSPESVNPGMTYNHNFNMFPKATLETQWVNTNPENEEDEISFTFTNVNYNCDCCTAQDVLLHGMNVDTSSVCDLYGNEWVRYAYSVTKESGFYTVFDSIYCPSLETTELLIEY